MDKRIKKAMMSMKAHARKLNKLVELAKEREADIATGKANDLLTFVDVSRKLRLNHDEIEDLITDSDGVLQMIVGAGVGGGIYEFKTTGEYQVEYCGEAK